jgi:hypothetical protein
MCTGMALHGTGTIVMIFRALYTILLYMVVVFHGVRIGHGYIKSGFGIAREN